LHPGRVPENAAQADDFSPFSHRLTPVGFGCSGIAREIAWVLPKD